MYVRKRRGNYKYGRKSRSRFGHYKWIKIFVRKPMYKRKWRKRK